MFLILLNRVNLQMQVPFSKFENKARVRFPSSGDMPLCVGCPDGPKAPKGTTRKFNGKRAFYPNSTAYLVFGAVL